MLIPRDCIFQPRVELLDDYGPMKGHCKGMESFEHERETQVGEFCTRGVHTPLFARTYVSHSCLRVSHRSETCHIPRETHTHTMEHTAAYAQHLKT